jgi:hypothetical protein
MKTFLTTLILGIFFSALFSVFSYATPVPVTNDLWDISQGSTVVAGTSYSGSDIRNMFGGTFGYVEPGNTLFPDGGSAGTVHSVEWRTSTPILLTDFNLFAAHDGGDRDATFRGFSKFELYAWIGGVWSSLYSYSPTNPYNPGLLNGLANNQLLLSDVVSPVIAQKFRAEFTQYGAVSGASGPRIYELDGFGSPVPEPSTLLLLGSALAGMAFIRKKKIS